MNLSVLLSKCDSGFQISMLLSIGQCSHQGGNRILRNAIEAFGDVLANVFPLESQPRLTKFSSSIIENPSFTV